MPRNDAQLPQESSQSLPSHPAFADPLSDRFSSPVLFRLPLVDHSSNSEEKHLFISSAQLLFVPR